MGRFRNSTGPQTALIYEKTDKENGKRDKEKTRNSLLPSIKPQLKIKNWSTADE
jgi:hypothetical protein